MRFGLLFLLVGLLPLSAQNTQLAGMQQDLVQLRTEVDKLKLENADLKEALARVKANQGGQSAAQADAGARGRTETLTEVDRRLKQQSADVNAALAELTRQVNAALGKGNSTPTPKTGANPKVEGTPVVAEEGAASDIPRNGIRYRVKSGETVSKIARANGSKVEWILQANKMPSAAALRADVEIFVPQPDNPAR